MGLKNTNIKNISSYKILLPKNLTSSS